MKATFYGKAEGNHTGFVRIKAERRSAKKEEIVLPFDVDVSSGNYFSLVRSSCPIFSSMLMLYN